MKGIAQRTLFYATFTALGLFFAEVVSSNAPPGLVWPPLYVMYGLLYILFLDFLMRYGSRCFNHWYLFGTLVGLLTETYVAKVMLFGLPNADLVWGLPLGSIVFLGFFYHAFYSFLLPVYVGKRFLGMPFPIPQNNVLDVIVFGAPLLLLPSIMTTNGGNPAFIMPTLVSCALLLVWVLVLRSARRPFDVLLSMWERVAWFLIVGATYMYFFLTHINTKAHGRTDPLALPWGALAVVSILTMIVFLVVVLSVRRSGKRQVSVVFDPHNMRIPMLAVYLAVYVITLLVPFVFVRQLVPVFMNLLLPMAILTSVVGTVVFVLAMYQSIKHSLR